MSIMQDQPSSYTAYARSLCPSWCSEAHDEHTDRNDLSAVHHRQPVSLPSGFEVVVSRYDDLTGDDDPAGVYLGNAELSAAEAADLGLALIRAAEAARRG